MANLSITLLKVDTVQSADLKHSTALAHALLNVGIGGQLSKANMLLLKHTEKEQQCTFQAPQLDS